MRSTSIPRFSSQIDHQDLPRQVNAARAVSTWISEYAFLYDRLLDPAVVFRAMDRAEALNVEPHDVLLSDGTISRDAYVDAVARHLGAARLRPSRLPGAGIRLVDATSFSPSALAEMAGDYRRSGLSFAFATPELLDSLEASGERHRRLNTAVRGLRRRDPALSAAGPIMLWQLVALLAGIGLLLGSAYVAPHQTRVALLMAVTVPFLLIVLFRILALWTTIRMASPPHRAAHIVRDDRDLPVYSVLVPLFREAAVLPDLVSALSRIDYPAAKLDCILILEASDKPTIALARSIELPPYMRLVVVPDQQPRTKPKALNYALQLSRGAFVAVYDAEDVPDPLQLRKAVAAFDAGGEQIVCVQAKLAIHNARTSWLTRQFALEYAALFEGLLPVLTRFHLPVPLGGTSNHFRREFLDAAGGWDPYNVTEDADLGIRIARTGGRIAMIHSLTWEEAPHRLRPWTRQRTRWLKGWMQTYLVHMRQPGRLWREMGPVNFAAFQVLLGGILLSSLFHPLFYLLLAWELSSGDFLAPSPAILDRGFLYLAGFNMIAGYISAMALAAIAMARAGRASLMAHVVLMPAYWLFVSFAAWRAVVQLAVAPHFWEKTEHAARRKGRGRTSSHPGQGAR